MTSTQWDFRSLTSSRAAAVRSRSADLVVNGNSARLSHVRDHACRFFVITVAHQSGFAQMFLALLRFGAEDMTQTRFMTLDFAGSRFFEALGSAFVCFEFRH